MTEMQSFFAETGREGGRRRMQKLTPQERSELARKAGLASGKARGKKAKKGK